MSDSTYVEGKQATTPRNPEYLPRADGTRCITLAGEAADYIASHKVWDHQRNGHILPRRSWNRLLGMIERLLPLALESEEGVSEDQKDAFRLLLETLIEIWGKPITFGEEDALLACVVRSESFEILERDPTILSRLEVSLRNLGRSERAGSRQCSLDDDSFLAPRKLAILFHVHLNPLRKRLDRWREKNHDGWIENEERGPREEKYLYKVGAVHPIIEELRKMRPAPSDQRTTSEEK